MMKVCSKAKALTLVEVVCALSLLAVTATALLVAQARSLEQLRSVKERAQAAELADQLMVAWRLEGAPLATDDEGLFDEQPNWTWRRMVVANNDAALHEVHLFIERRLPGQSRRLLAEYVWLEYADDD